jgi:hypothetical protein
VRYNQRVTIRQNLQHKEQLIAAVWLRAADLFLEDNPAAVSFERRLLNRQILVRSRNARISNLASPSTLRHNRICLLHLM